MESAENHFGMQKLGAIARKGMTLSDLQRVQEYYNVKGKQTELVDLRAGLNDDIREAAAPAYILIVSSGVADADLLYLEQKSLHPDTKAKMRGRVVNKHARYNLCFDDESQEPDYENGKGRVVSFSDVPHTEAQRQ